MGAASCTAVADGFIDCNVIEDRIPNIALVNDFVKFCVKVSSFCLILKLDDNFDNGDDNCDNGAAVGNTINWPAKNL